MTLQYAKQPCAECPWRKDTEPGQFPAGNYMRPEMQSTSGTRGNEAGLDAPIFACHKSADGKEIACAGWLAAVGHDHLGVRYAVITGRLPGEVLEPKQDWPELFETYDEMASAQGARD